MNHSHPMSATQAKERHYAQLANSLTRLSRSVGQTADLFEQLQIDLDSMRTLAALHAAQFMSVATRLNPEAAAHEEGR
ncbi:hypothetical protein HETIRDRAFT_453490 [Heterobasidion irregulare TC 32-1]|uniref:Uncharacterized protein n=1 Tax=Heterobasidion irregulare (strain TC 32-1) TaxID=747525 RepID=W4JZH8_HETIT|nr:uncharacterized protein HETIRDRAFT_453490 [Heterobasidion irregulare TC 32-1]ETW78952.1 hypothetical protein HETIRDRAFT_453490 [Heterobasidion irregulare TC 32-1]